MISGSSSSWQTEEEKVEAWQILFSWALKSLYMVIAAMKLKICCSLEGSYDKHRQHIKKQRHHFADKGPSSQRYGFSSSHVWMWELGLKEGWAPKNWSFQTVVLNRTLASPLDCQQIRSVSPEGDQPWVLPAGTDAGAKALMLGSPDAKSWLTAKTLISGQTEDKEKGVAEGEMAHSVPSSVGMSLSKLQEAVDDRGAWCFAVPGVTGSGKISDWTTVTMTSA